MSRYARKIDANSGAIVDALRRVGALVEPRLSRVGGGVPDLLCGYRGRLVLLEVKDGAKAPSARALTPDEKAWIQAWAGYSVHVVESIDEAVLVVTGRRVELHRGGK